MLKKKKKLGWKEMAFQHWIIIDFANTKRPNWMIKSDTGLSTMSLLKNIISLFSFSASAICSRLGGGEGVQILENTVFNWECKYYKSSPTPVVWWPYQKEHFRSKMLKLNLNCENMKFWAVTYDCLFPKISLGMLSALSNDFQKLEK